MLWLLSVGFNPSDIAQRELLLYLMMTSCDLSDQVKPFDSASTAAVRLNLTYISIQRKLM